jgi:hypothetical protein
VPIVSFTERDARIRIISARRATKREHRDHEENTKQAEEELERSAGGIRLGLWKSSSESICGAHVWRRCRGRAGRGRRASLRFVEAGQRLLAVRDFGDAGAREERAYAAEVALALSRLGWWNAEVPADLLGEVIIDLGMSGDA